MVEWGTLVDELADAGYTGFEFDSGRASVPGLSGEWVIGSIPRRGALAQSNMPLYMRILDAVLGTASVDTDPERTPEELRGIADEYGVDVIIVSCDTDSVRVALCYHQ